MDVDFKEHHAYLMVVDPEYKRACKVSMDTLISPRRSKPPANERAIGSGASSARLPAIKFAPPAPRPKRRPKRKDNPLKNHGWQRVRVAAEAVSKWQQSHDPEVVATWGSPRSRVKLRNLRTHAPAWWHMGDEIVGAADAFDSRHQRRAVAAERLCLSLHEMQTSGNAARAEHELVEAFERARFDVQTNRFLAPDPRPPDPLAPRKPPRPTRARTKLVAPVEFDVYKSIWAPRAKWADSKDVYDTGQVAMRRFEVDLSTLLQMGLSKLVLMYDDDEVVGDEDGDGIPDEVEDVAEVLWEHQDTLFAIFSYYACASGRGRCDQLSLNQWTEFTSDFGLVSSKAKHCKRADVDRVFLAADAQSEPELPSKGAGVKDSKNMLSRRQFYLALVRLAIARYVLPKVIVDVSEALSRLLQADIRHKMEASGHEGGVAISADRNGFRHQHCYTAAIEAVLRENERSLHNLFGAVASAGGGSSRDSALMSLDEWKAFVHAAGLVGVDVSDRDAVLCFAWSRMTVVDVTRASGREKENSLPFEGFLEALGLKALPTRQEMASAGFHKAEECAAYLEYLRSNHSEDWQRLLRTRAAPWGSEPSTAHAESVAMVISLIEAAIERETRGKDDAEISKAEATEWVRSKMALQGQR